MMTLINFISYGGIFFTSSLLLGQIIQKYKSFRNYCLIIIFISTNLIIFSELIWYYDSNFSLLPIYFFHIPLLFLLPGLLYCYLTGLYSDKNIHLWNFPHWIPIILAIIIYLPFYSIGNQTKFHILNTSKNLLDFSILQMENMNLFFFLYKKILEIGIIFPELLQFFYIALIFYQIRSQKHQKLNKEKKLVRFLAIQLTVTSFIILLTQLTHNYYLFILEILFINLFFLSLYLISNRIPNILLSEVKKEKYHYSRIKKINTAKKIQQLNDFMNKEKAFCDEDITLEKVAMELEITNHQLSEILNQELEKNFKNFINEYRIKESKELLINDTTRSVLSIALSVGFNSKSTFNKTFSNFVGMTPSQYRKSNSLKN